jgi:hypothetical protein
VPGRKAAINFDFELSRGLVAYNEALGKWWHLKACDVSHLRAYRKIADFIGASLLKPPRLIAEYACGTCSLLFRLSEVFPASRLVGLDGSAYLLDFARRRLKLSEYKLKNRITLIEIPLPSFDKPRLKADLAVFSFPNMVPSGKVRFGPYLKPIEVKTARKLAYAADPTIDEDNTPEMLRLSLLLGRLVSLHLRRLLKRGALCIRVEYARAPRHELSKIQLMRTEYEEGSLDMDTGGQMLKPWFRVLASSFFNSRVIRDVDQQAGKRCSGPGGFTITILRAI